MVALSQKILEKFYVSNINIPNHYSTLSLEENLNELFTVLGGKFKFSAQDSNSEYLCWRCKNSPVSSDLKPPSPSTKIKGYMSIKILLKLL